MTSQETPHTAAWASTYDPFRRGAQPVGVRTIEARDSTRDWLFPCEIWYPAAAHHAGQDLAPATQDVFTLSPGRPPLRQAAIRDAAAWPGTYPLILFSHASFHHRRGATFLTTHLASHGYVVAALNHSEITVPALARRDDETAEQKAARVDAVIGSRVPDVRFLLDYLLQNGAGEPAITLDADRIGVAGHSFGGWTVLAVTEVEPRVCAVVSLAPGGALQPRPGILPLKLSFDWRRDVPTLVLAADGDVSLPLAGISGIFNRIPATKLMVILRRADHAHFMDNVEQAHEAVRMTAWPETLAWLGRETRPIAELCTGDAAHLFTRGLALCHLDAVLRQRQEARRFLAGDIAAELARRDVDAFVHKPERR